MYKYKHLILNYLTNNQIFDYINLSCQEPSSWRHEPVHAVSYKIIAKTTGFSTFRLLHIQKQSGFFGGTDFSQPFRAFRKHFKLLW